MAIFKTRAVGLALGASILGMIVLGLVRGVDRVRDAAGQGVDQMHLKQIHLALSNYDSTHGSLPPAIVPDKNGKPLFSWRVIILPYIEGQSLYKQFHLDEPWDSDHNISLLDQMPPIFGPGNRKAKCPPFHTYYRVFTGRGTPFEGGKSLDFKTAFPDGLAGVFLVVEAGEPVPWTRPDELAVQDGQPLPPLAGIWPKRFQTVMADGTLWTTEKPLNEAAIRRMVYRVKPR